MQSFGLQAPEPQLLQAVAIGLTHRSHLYEQRNYRSELTVGVLDALQGLGSNFVRKQAAVEMLRGSTFHTPGALSSAVAHVHAVLSTWAAEQTWLARSCAISKGLDAEALPPKVPTAICQQLLGVLCLAGEAHTAAAIVREVIVAAQIEDVADPKTTLQERLHPAVPSYGFERTGPDHEPAFRALVSDGRGRQGVGQGRNKKLASKAAALDFLRRHLPQALVRQSASKAPRSIPSEIPEQIAHRQVVSRLQDVFELGDAARPLLSQALIHTSWAYEHKDVVAAYHQQDNQILGFLGSQVLNFEHSLACAWRVLRERPSEFTALTLPNQSCVAAFQRARLAPGLLLGTGQRLHGVPPELAGNTFQAVVGAVFVHHDFPTSLSPLWPQAWEDLRQLVFPGTSPSLGPATLMQRATSAMRLEVDVMFDVEGAGTYKPSYQARVLLRSTMLGDGAGSVAVTGPRAGDKTTAKHLAAQGILDALHLLAQPELNEALARVTQSERRLALFILAHQVATLAERTVPVRRWIESRLAGLHLADTDLLAWMEEADRLLTLPESARPRILGGPLSSTLRVALHPSADLAGEPSDELEALLAQVERIEEPGELTADLLSRLVELCAIYRGLSDSIVIDLPELADEWRLLHRGRLSVTDRLPPVRLFGVERAVLDAAVRAVLTSTGGATVHAGSSTRPCLQFRAEVPLVPSHLTRICALWSGPSGTIKLAPAGGGIDATVLRSSDAPGPLTEATLMAMQHAGKPHHHVLANLLHDMKNQLVAVRQAAVAHATGRTARLERQLTASRHLDQAHSLAVRLRSTASLLASADTGCVELGSELRDYATSLLPRLPRAIRLNVPDARSEVLVALEGRALTAILDNLVGNSITALRDGGAIALDWTADDKEAVIEISDDGPGLPPEVRASLERGVRIRTTSPGGNGLGLLGVRALLDRVGGQLTSPPTSVGTAWLISLPLFDPSQEAA
ncbi:ATP-binding protein [Streptomyces lydicus]